MKTNKKNWNNNWVVGTSTGLLAVFILRMIDFFANTQILKSIWGIMKQFLLLIISFFTKDYIISLWGIILLIIIVISIIIFILWCIVKFQKDDTSSIQPDFLNYRKDIFDNVLYKWEYINSYGKYIITNFTAYCPQDNCIINYNECPICKSKYNYIKNNTELEILIRYKIENNLYK